MNIEKHRRAFDRFYTGHVDFDSNGLKDLVFPLLEIDRIDWKRGAYGDRYYSYCYRRFSCHILSKMALAGNQRILNIGCGFGLDEKNIKYLVPSCELWSVDVSRFMLELAKQSGCPTRLSLSAGEFLPFPDNCFDRILCTEVIEHVIARNLVIKEVHRVLKPRGLGVITTVNPDSWSPSVKLDTGGAKGRLNIDTRGDDCSIIDDAPSLEMMKRYIKRSQLILKEVFYDGALYFFLNSKQNRYKDRLPLIADYFTCLESSRWIASRFCDQMKYVVYKEEHELSKCFDEDIGAIIPYVCPHCHASLVNLVNQYQCRRCGKAYRVLGGIPEFIPHQMEEMSPEAAHSKVGRSIVGSGPGTKRVIRRILSKLALQYRSIYGPCYFLAAKLLALLFKRKFHSC